MGGPDGGEGRSGAGDGGGAAGDGGAAAAGGPLARLAAVLGAASDHGPPGATELAELLWLAGQLPGPAAPPPPRGTPGARHEPPPAPEAPAPHTPPPAPPPPRRDTPPAAQDRVPLRLPGADDDTAGPAHTSLLAPAPPMLTHPLALQRALRPLARRVASPVGRELDEEATATRIANLQAPPGWWLPVLRPARERWLRLRLVVDTGPTMPVWRPLARELHTALAQSGVFRTVEPLRALPDGTVRGPLGTTAADGRTVTLLVSDCMGPQWWHGEAADRWYATLRRWAALMPLAVVQPLPERLWAGTALPAVPGLLTARAPAAPTATLGFAPYDERAPEPGSVPLPVLEAAPGWLRNWAALVADPGGARLPAAVAALPRAGSPVPVDAADRADLTRLPPRELVGAFRASASPEAFRLAGHLALGEPRLPVMRLVQAAVEARPRPQHLAEVVLSGMLTAVPGPPGTYAFRPGVRELLLRSLPRTGRERTTALLDRVGALIDARAGVAPGEFRALAPSEGGGRTAPGGEPFARVSRQSVRELGGGGGAPRETGGRTPPLLGGRYRALKQLTPGGATWRAEDLETGDTVLLRAWRPQGGLGRQRAFREVMRALRGVEHRNITRVLDHGEQDGIAYAVLEYLDGVRLHTMAAVVRYRLPAALLVSVARQLAEAVAAARDAGAPQHFNERMVLLLPDGTVKLSLFGASDRRERLDYPALGTLLRTVGDGLPPPARTVFDGLVDDLLGRDEERQRTAVERLRAGALDRLPAEVDDGGLEFRLLDGVGVRQRHPRRRDLLPGEGAPPALLAFLTALLLRQGRMVTLEELSAFHWGGELLRDQQLQSYARELRRVIGPGRLAAATEGYALHISTDDLDVLRSASLAREAAELRARGDLREAYETVGQALALWRGEPLAGIEGAGVQAAREQLLDTQADLCRERAELGLELRLFVEVAAELERVTARFPADRHLGDLRQTALWELEPYRDRPSLAVPDAPHTQYATFRMTLPGADRPDAFDCVVQAEFRLDGHVETPRRPQDVGRRLEVEFRRAARRATVTHRSTRPRAAEEELHEALRDWAPPGVRVLRVHARLERSPVTPTPPKPLLPPRAPVLLGFDGIVVDRVFSKEASIAATRELTRLASELVDPEEALAGRLLESTRDMGGRSARLDPVSVLRAFTNRRMAVPLDRRLAELEADALADARPATGLREFAERVAADGHRVGVVSDVSATEMVEFLRRTGLFGGPVGMVDGRASDGVLLSAPDCLLSAARNADAAPADCVLITASETEAQAAGLAGMPFVGCHRSASARSRLERAGALATVRSLTEIGPAEPGAPEPR
ncbi:SAV_2336 N-terminal domain-related protein [Streptomyces sp. NPDC050560]|uniref:SAV_2336 N-terminal domain-related protein n=1 Tax=Streptomyces sp. NPDC050560 TaxID=3365630 RepID=UPI00378F4CBA